MNEKETRNKCQEKVVYRSFVLEWLVSYVGTRLEEIIGLKS